MLQEGISKHRPGGKLSKWREQVGKSPKAGLISAGKWSFETKRRSAGWRRLLMQDPKHSRVCTWKALTGFKLGKIWPVLCFWETCLFPCAESISLGIPRIWSSWLPTGRGSGSGWEARAGGRSSVDPLFTSDSERIIYTLRLDAGTGRKLLQMSRTNLRQTYKNLVTRLWERGRGRN